MKLVRRGMAGLLPAFLLSCLPAILLAQPTPGILDRLNDPDFAVRQQATRSLLQDTTLTLDTIVEWMSQAQTPEQRHRLLRVARHHLLRQAREGGERDALLPAIGFSHEVLQAGVLSGVDSGAVHIVATLPGFPAHAYLAPGDVLIELDDRPLPADLTPQVFQELLRQYRPGQMIALTVLRGRETVRVELQLASLEMLTTIYSDEPTLRDPYATRWRALRERLLADAPAVRVLTPAE